MNTTTKTEMFDGQMICEPCHDECSSCNGESTATKQICMMSRWYVNPVRMSAVVAMISHCYQTDMYDEQMVCEPCQDECSSCNGKSLLPNRNV